MDSVCVIGSGAAGCVLALRLARLGIRVTVLESGPRYSDEQKMRFFEDRMRGKTRPGDNPYKLKQRSIEAFRNAGDVKLPADFERVRALGGTTLWWLGNCPRMLKADFKMRSTFGVSDDWPIGYDDLEPYYGQAEVEIGVAGAPDNPFAEYRSTPYPMPPVPFSYSDELLKKVTDRLGIEYHHTPQARNSVDYGGRPQCASCVFCQMCPINARATFDLTHAIPAEQTGLARFVTDATVQRIEVDDSGKVTRAVYAGLDRVERAVEADVFVVAAGGIETPRLLLLSKSRLFPEGLANRSGLVGKYLMDHPISQVSGRIADPVYPFRVGFEATESFQFYASKNRGEVAAFLSNMNNADGVGPTPAEVAEWSYSWGDELVSEIRREFGHTLSLSAGVDQLPDEKNTVTLDPENKDYFGQPIPLITYRFDEYTQRGLEKADEVQGEIMKAAGATDITGPPGSWWPGHHMGTTRMGNDPKTSVVDKDSRCHDVPNLYIAGPSVYVTTGAANPVLTIAALALRLGDHLAKGR